MQKFIKKNIEVQAIQYNGTPEALEEFSKYNDPQFLEGRQPVLGHYAKRDKAAEKEAMKK